MFSSFFSAVAGGIVPNDADLWLRWTKHNASLINFVFSWRHSKLDQFIVIYGGYVWSWWWKQPSMTFDGLVLTLSSRSPPRSTQSQPLWRKVTATIIHIKHSRASDFDSIYGKYMMLHPKFVDETQTSTQSTSTHTFRRWCEKCEPGLLLFLVAIMRY